MRLVLIYHSTAIPRLLHRVTQGKSTSGVKNDSCKGDHNFNTKFIKDYKAKDFGYVHTLRVTSPVRSLSKNVLCIGFNGAFTRNAIFTSIFDLTL
jgi:hypothetical protein